VTRQSAGSLAVQEGYPALGEMMWQMAAALEPPERLTPSQAAAKYRHLQIPGAYNGPYLNETTPYMVEPLDCQADPTIRAIVFVGGAQIGKTASLVLNALLYAIMCDPIDAIVYQTSQTVAADFSRTQVDRMLRHSPEVGARLLPGGSDDTVHAKYFRSGTVVNLSWPTINEMSGRPRGLVILTDYDRMPQDIDGEGSPFDLGRKRTTTFRSKAKTICESSPGFEVSTGSSWLPRTKHEAPPCDGILALYNRGDRRRYYWPCDHCQEWFEPHFDLLVYDHDLEPQAAGKTAQMACPHCGGLHAPERKFDLNLAGRWVKDGQRLLKGGALEGEAISSDIASFWLFGVCAAFMSWADLVTKYRQALQEYERTGSQEALKATINTDQAMPYRRRGQNTERLPEDLKQRAETLPRGVVPMHVRFLLTTIDVQGRKFVVQTHGITPGAPFGMVVIDRYDITKSERRDADGERHMLEPAAYAEDWELLSPVIEREYPLADGSGLMRVRMVGCDSGGKEGVTHRAYEFWSKLRREGGGLHSRFQLVKGNTVPNAPRAVISYPDANRKDKKSGLRGDVPVLLINGNIVKDQLDGMLNNIGLVQWAEWLPDEFFAELCVEVREMKGWVNPQRRRNESWDLFAYCIALCIWSQVEHINWEKPPTWALPGLENTLVRLMDVESKLAPVRPERKAGMSMTEMARALAG
jgi:phage terminase large subunit GpA-like protein